MGFSIRTKLIFMVGLTLFLAISSAAYLIRGLVYERIVDQKMATVDILTASLVHDIKYDFKVLERQSIDEIIAKFMTYYRVIQNISFYGPDFVNRADATPESIGQTTQDRDVRAAIQYAKPSLSILDSDLDNFRIRSIAPILQGSRIVGAVVLDISIQDIQVTLSSIDRRILAILIVTVLMACAGLFFLLRSTVLIRLGRLMRVTRQIAAGNYDIQVGDSQRDEIGGLARSFDQMTTDLKRSKREIDKYNQHLEEMVREQTAQLQKAYEDLKSAQGQLVLNEKMASLGILIAGIAHEITTPVGTIHNISRNLNAKIANFPKMLEDFKKSSDVSTDQLGSFLGDLLQASCSVGQSYSYEEIKAIERTLEKGGIEDYKGMGSNLAKLKFGDPEKIQKYIAYLQNPVFFSLAESFGSIAQGIKISETSSQKIAEIVRALKYYAYTDKGKVENIQINESIQTAMVLLRNRFKYKFSVTTDLYPNIPRVLCTSEIHQVWTNLLSNACDAIEVLGDDYHGEVLISTCKEDDHILITVSDNGIGIPKSDLDKIYDPFFTTKEIGKGTGLGLSIVSGIVKKHNGTIDVKSRPGETVFRITLPIHEIPSPSLTRKDNNTNGQGSEERQAPFSSLHRVE